MLPIRNPKSKIENCWMAATSSPQTTAFNSKLPATTRPSRSSSTPCWCTPPTSAVMTTTTGMLLQWTPRETPMWQDTPCQATSLGPTPSGAPGCEFGCNDWAFVTKINASGNSFAYSAIESASSVTGIAVDSAGNAYLVGSGFPTTPGAFQTMSCVNCYTVSVAKLSAAGNQLIYGAFISDNQGSATDFPGGIAVDSSGSAVITGYTFDIGFPTVKAIQNQCLSSQ